MPGQRNHVRRTNRGRGGHSRPSAKRRQEARVLFDYDVIVVGGGAGGATFAYACARAGKSVLVLERGRKHPQEEATLDERTSLIDKNPYDDREVEVNGSTSRL